LVQCEQTPAPHTDGFKEGLREIGMDEVKKHDNAKDGIWVTFNGGVYDITDFIENHPGGASKIILAAGGSLEPFWSLYQQHQEQFVYDILEEMRIGNLKKEDQAEQMKKVASNDPYGADPQRSPLLLVRSSKPFNAEPPLELLDSTTTPNDLFYVRNHLPVPDVQEKDYNLQVEGKNGEKLSLSLSDLKSKFKEQSVVATVMCAGNRRNEMDSIKKVKGGYWEAGAISTAKWTGVLLSDVLTDAGIKEEDVKHIQFEGLDQDATTSTVYGASIPAEVAFDPRQQVLLAYEMNGVKLPRDHGYPVRVIVPGIVGARNVKWLGKIVASTEESDSHWQQNDYKGFNPSIDWHNVDFSTAPAIQELPVISAICSTTVHDDEVDVQGYAYSGGGRGIIRVDVTADDGENWVSADLKPADESQKRNHVYGWTIWSAKMKLPKRTDGQKIALASRAVDSQYNVQPESCGKIWNLRGVLSNAWHKRVIE